MAEIWGAALIAGGAVAGAAISSSGAKSAANTAANASANATNAQQQMFNTTQANYKPQIELGQGAANMLGGIYGIGGVTGGTGATTKGTPSPNYAAFYNTPGYQFSLSQGEGAINKQAAANGNLYSSNTLGALGGYAAGQASTQYNSYINQLTTMAGLGNAASSGVGAAATATGQGEANSIQNAGNAQSLGILGQSNAFSNAIGSLSNNSNLLGALNGGGTSNLSTSGYNGQLTDMGNSLTPTFTG